MYKYFIDLILKYKFLLCAFLITFLAYIFAHNFCNMGLFFDIPAEVMNMVTQSDYNFDKYFILNLAHTRNFYYLFNSVIFNTLIHIFQYKNMLEFVSLFSTSYIVSHFILLALNFVVAKRTRRFDIAIIALSFFCFFSIPSYIWAIRELTPNILIYFIMLQFFLAKNKQNHVDFILITLLLVYLYSSYETTIFMGIIAFISLTLFHNKKNVPNIYYKIYIGVGSLFIAFLMVIRLLLHTNTQGVSLLDALHQWINGSILTFQFIPKSNLIIPAVMCVVTLIICFFYKRSLSKKTILFLAPVLYLIYYLLQIKTNFVPNARIEMHFYSLALWFFAPIIFLIILIDANKFPFIIKFRNFYPNLLILSIITGILNFAWQFNSCIMFKEYVSYLQSLLNNSKKMIVVIPKEDYKRKDFLCFDTAFGTTHKTIFLSKNKKIEKILIPYFLLQDYDYNEQTYYYYDEDRDEVVLQNQRYKTVTKYWDLSKFKQKYIKEDRVE